MGEKGSSRMGAGAVVVLIAAEGLRLQVVDFLSHYGFTVMEAQPGSELLELEECDCAIGLLLADVPVEAGPALLSHFARRSPDLRVLLISGDPECVNRELVPDPCVHFIEKPFAWCELGDQIARLLRPAVSTADARRAEPKRALAAA